MPRTMETESRSGPRYLASLEVKAEWDVPDGTHIVAEGTTENVGPEGTLTVYNMEHPVIGGYTPEKVALRRAINLAVDVPREINTVRRSQAIPAQSPCVPHTSGYDPHYKSEMGDHDPARAMALLDMYGYVDRDGDGFREQPNGEPLLIVRRTHSEGLQRQLDALWQKNLKAVGLNVQFQVAQWPENLKAAQAGNFMVWAVGSSSAQPDGIGGLQRLYGPASGGANLALQECRVRRALRPHAAHPRRPGAREAVPPGQADVGRMGAVPPARAPHLQRHDASVARRLPAAVLLAALVAHDRHRQGRAGPADGLTVRREARP